MKDRVIFKLEQLNNGIYQIAKYYEYEDQYLSTNRYTYFETRLKFLAFFYFKRLINKHKKEQLRIEGKNVKNILLEEEIK